LPVDVVRVRLPGLGLRPGHVGVGEVAVQTVLAVLRQVISSGDYWLVILDGIRNAIGEAVLTEDDLQSLVASPAEAESTEMAMT
jgi:hypothetical protein